MVEIREPGLLAATIELELERYRRAALLVRMPSSMGDLADALDRIAAMLHEAEDRGQAVDLADAIVGLIRQFRGTLAALGGAPAQA